MPPPVVTIPYAALQSNTIPISTLLTAFGPSSLGILLISDLPAHYAPLRKQLLTLSRTLAHLPSGALHALEVPTAKYLVGWSLGKERLPGSGAADTLKGSFYANPTAARHGVAEAFPDLPEYTTANVWPRELPELEPAMLEMCGFVVEVAKLVAAQIDRFAVSEVAAYPRARYLADMLAASSSTKARLLHYYPPREGEDEAEWCGVHKDHGCLTGLTAALYHDPVVEDPEEGLWITARTGEEVKVVIPEGCLAFQTGEALERITAGRLKAVPHAVRPGRSGAKGGGRSTLAVFTQPDLGDVVDFATGETFAEFARGVVRGNTVGEAGEAVGGGAM